MDDRPGCVRCGFGPHPLCPPPPAEVSWVSQVLSSAAQALNRGGCC